MKPSQVKQGIRKALKIRMIQSRIQRLMNKVKPLQTRKMHNSSNLNAIVQELRETVSVNKFEIFVKENEMETKTSLAIIIESRMW